MTPWRWIGAELIHTLHDRQISEHGGLPGVRDGGAIASALARPQNLAAYGSPDAADLAAAYAFGLARNHGFCDGNKRIAWIIARLFLADNGASLVFTAPEAIATMLLIASGDLPEPAAAAWFRTRIQVINAPD